MDVGHHRRRCPGGVRRAAGGSRRGIPDRALTSFLNPEGAGGAAAYNARQARIAIGVGGWFGHGLFSGTADAGQFVPVNETDFIFTVIGEEAGYTRCDRSSSAWHRAVAGNAHRDGCRRHVRRLVATGLSPGLAFQAFENIGMTLGHHAGHRCAACRSSPTAARRCSPSWIALGLLANVQSAHLRLARRTAHAHRRTGRTLMVMTRVNGCPRVGLRPTRAVLPLVPSQSSTWVVRSTRSPRTGTTLPCAGR